jgi:hypothetical protein
VQSVYGEEKRREERKAGKYIIVLPRPDGQQRRALAPSPEQKILSLSYSVLFVRCPSAVRPL